MTIPSSTARSGPYNANGVTDVFAYEFRIVDEDHLRVILTDADDVEADLAIDTHYTVSDVGDPTGSINLTSAGLALAVSGTKITILRNPPFTQETDLQNQGAYFAEVVEDRFDLITMQIQTVKEEVDRSVKIPASDDGTTLPELIEDIVRLGASADNIDTVADSIGDVTTVAGSIASVNTVAARDADIATVAARDADIGTVADRDADIGTVADNIAAVLAAPGHADNAAASAAAAATSETNAGTAETGAETARDFAARWASDPEDGPPIDDGVNPPNQSAYHWAMKASENALGDMLAATYDQNGLATDVFDSAHHVDFVASDIPSKTIPASVNAIRVSGASTPGDRLADLYVRVTDNLGPNLIFNGDFAASAGWQLSNATISGGDLNINNSATAYQAILLKEGVDYSLTHTITSVTGAVGGLLSVGNTSTGTTYSSRSAPGTYTQTRTAPAGVTGFRFGTGGTSSAEIDNVELREVLVAPEVYQSADGAWWRKAPGGTVAEELTYYVPADYPDLQAAINALSGSQFRNGGRINLNIQTGYVITTGLALYDGNFGHFRITSTDAEVAVDAAFSNAVYIIEGWNARMPRLACLINANGRGRAGVYLDETSTMAVAAGCGIKNSFAAGLATYGASSVSAKEAVWSGSAVNGTTQAGATIWGGSTADLTGADVSGSGYYGVQAAHAALVCFLNGNADGSYRHGIRATDAGYIDANGATADNAVTGGSGYSIIAHQGSIISFSEGSAINSGDFGLLSYAGSIVNAENATITGSAAKDLRVMRNSLATIIGGTASTFEVGSDSRVYNVDGALSGAAAVRRSGSIASGIMSFTPNAGPTTFLQVDTEGGASTDNLDAFVPDSGYGVDTGHMLIVKSAALARVITLRDRNTSGAATGGLELPGGTSITLGTSNAIATFIRNDTVWLLVSVSQN